MDERDLLMLADLIVAAGVPDAADQRFIRPVLWSDNKFSFLGIERLFDRVHR